LASFVPHGAVVLRRRHGHHVAATDQESPAKGETEKAKGDASIVDTNVSECREIPTMAVSSDIAMLQQLSELQRTRIAMRSSRGGSHPGRDLSDCAFAKEQARSVAMNPSVRPGDMSIANSLNRIVGDWPATF